MTDTPDLPPPSPTAPPPVTDAPASRPPGTPAGRPRIWQAAVLFVACGALAGGSCTAFLGGVSSAQGAGDLWPFLFIASTPVAAGAFALLVFRLWRRRVAEAWPSVGQAVLMAVAGAVL